MTTLTTILTQYLQYTDTISTMILTQYLQWYWHNVFNDSDTISPRYWHNIYNIL